MEIHESAEDYLEAILMLKERRGAVRSIDIANELGYSKPSVSVAMKHLRENGYVLMDEDGFLTLTNKGYVIARRADALGIAPWRADHPAAPTEAASKRSDA